MSGRRSHLAVVAALALGLAATWATSFSAAAGPSGYRVTNLVSDERGVAARLDPNLVNGWGLAAGPSTPWWVADNGTDVSTLYDGSGMPLPLVVKVRGAPTGAVFNGGSGFVVSHEGQSGPALFLFSTESGTIRGWNPNVGTSGPPSMRSFVVVDRSRQGAIYKGLAIASTSGGELLYATDFHNARVDVFDADLGRVRQPGAFEDARIPDGFAPFGIQSIGEAIFVTYAKQDPAAEDDVAGPALGFVDMFDTSGKLLARVASRGTLNAPWGLAMAPEGFGRFGGDLLVGNFGNGKIHAFELSSSGSGQLAGTLQDPSGKPIAIDGLWAIGFGNDAAAGPSTSLFFTAGPDEETRGLFGKIEAAGP